MNIDGSQQRRISFGGGRYATPEWSPRGDLIAFTKMGGGEFRIGIMTPAGGGERLLTNSWQDEAPTWSPNGRVIQFFRTTPGRNGKSRSEEHTSELQSLMRISYAVFCLKKKKKTKKHT